MSKTPSTMLPLGTRAPDFALPDTDGKMVSLASFSGAPATVVVFMCNHCPFVVHIRPELATFAKDVQAKGVAFVGINSNDVENYPDDSPEKMKQEVAEQGYSFPYLYDETQQVAQAYRAACTPDFYLFDRQHRLVYRGQFDDSRPGSDVPVTGADLGRAVDKLLAGEDNTGDQKPSIGCNIKWKPGHEPDYFG